MNDKLNEINIETPEVKITTGNMSIISSGTGITLDKNADFKITLKFSEDYILTVQFEFQNDINSEESSIKKKICFPTLFIKIICINFYDLVGISIEQPIYLVTYKGKEIYLNFWITTSTSKIIREIRYCFYTQEEKEYE